MNRLRNRLILVFVVATVLPLTLTLTFTLPLTLALPLTHPLPTQVTRDRTKKARSAFPILPRCSRASRPGRGFAAVPPSVNGKIKRGVGSLDSRSAARL